MVRRRVLELLPARHAVVLVPRDVVVGARRRRLVPAEHDEARGRGRHPVRAAGEDVHREEGRPHRQRLVGVVCSEKSFFFPA